MKPIGNWIWIEKEESPNKIGMILLADTRYVSKSKACRIHGIGSKVDKDFEVGKRCIVLEYDGVEIPGMENHYLVKPDQVWALVDDDVKVEPVRNKVTFNAGSKDATGKMF